VIVGILKEIEAEKNRVFMVLTGVDDEMRAFVQSVLNRDFCSN
jgi:hypothetical protein